jgi:hypothetical protein
MATLYQTGETEDKALPVQSDTEATDRLLKRLTDAVPARRRLRNGLKVVYGVGLTSYFVLLWPALIGNILPSLPLPVALSSISLVFVLLWQLNSAFYRRLVPLLREVAIPLAERGEERALGPLLDLMDARISGVGGWGTTRPLFVQTMSTLFRRMTPLGFQSLTDMQVNQITPLLMMPEAELRDAVTDLFIRCGDSRALRALERVQRLYKVQHLQRWNPALKPMISLFRKLKMPALDEQTREHTDICHAAIQSRLNAEQSSVQLLRASDSIAGAGPDQLLRAAQAQQTDTDPNQLMRAAMPALTSDPAPVSNLDSTLHESKVEPQQTRYVQSDTKVVQSNTTGSL